MTENRTYAHAVIVAAVAFGLVGCANWGGNGSTTAQARSDRPATTASAEPTRGPVQTVSDAAITAKVKTALGNDELVKARNINVDTLRGEVTLNGTVNSAAEKERAISLAKRVDGVANVKDNLRTAG
jgi:hyperosmotically inducible protein